MKKIVENLETRTQGVLFESVVDEVAELLGVEPSEVEDSIDRLAFSDYLELGNAVDIGDEDLAREILGMVGGLGEVSAFDADDEDEEEGGADLIDQFDDGDSDEDDDDYDDGEFDMGLEEADNAFGGGGGDNSFSKAPAQPKMSNDDEEDEDENDTLDQTSISQLKAKATQQAAQTPARASTTLNPAQKAAAMKRLQGLKQGDEVFVRGLDGKPVKATYQGADKSRQDFMAAVKTDKDRANTRTFGYDDLMMDDELGDEEMNEGYGFEENDSVEAVKNALYHRIGRQHLDLIDKYGIDAVMQAIDSVAYDYGSAGLEEIGSSDISAFVNAVGMELGEADLFEGEPVSEEAPPGMEDWIKARKPEFKKRYGDRWQEVLYATAWKQHNKNESLGEAKWSKPKDPWTPDAKIPEKFYRNGKLVKDQKYKDWVDSQRDTVEESEDTELARIKALAGIKSEPVTESARYGIYRRSKTDWEAWQNDGWKGNTQAASAKVKRGGKHLTFKSKGAAEKWAKENSKKEEFFVRKVSKPVKPVKETASGGATGAGAIATGPVAVGGMQKRNPSIYAGTKPEPKPRKKDKKDDGLGRTKKS